MLARWLTAGHERRRAAAGWRGLVALTLAAALALGATGCTRVPPAGEPVWSRSAGDEPAWSRSASSAPGSSAATAVTLPASHADVREAELVIVRYTDALRSEDATEATESLAEFRREGPLAPDWQLEITRWRTRHVRALSHPGKYFTDERASAQLYSDRSHHPPFKLVVVNVAYSTDTTGTHGDVDFVVTKDGPDSEWLISDFGGGGASD
jgi:hypothetical protein